MLPSEYVIYDNSVLNTYKYGKKNKVIEVKEKYDRWSDYEILLPLPNHRFLFTYSDAQARQVTSIGNYDSDELISTDILINNTHIPAVTDGSFTTHDSYIQIDSDNKDETKKLPFVLEYIIPANIKSDLSIKSNINNLLVTDEDDEGIFMKTYNSIVKFDLDQNQVILAWFDNRYIISLLSEGISDNKLIIYDLTQGYDKFTNILKLNEYDMELTLPHVKDIITAEQLGLNDISSTFTHTAPDNSIDIFMYDSHSNIAVLHITLVESESSSGDSSITERDLEIENYPYSEHKNIIIGIQGDEFGIIINNMGSWFYINRYDRTITELGKGELLTFSNELYRENIKKTIKESDATNLVTNVKGIIGEYV